MKHTRIIGISLLILAVVAIAAMALLAGHDDTTDQLATTDSETVEPDEVAVPVDSDDSQVVSEGRYVAYTEDFVSDPSFQTTLLFFHAPWCPECRAFEQAIETGGVPDGVQVLKVDYDSSQSLKERYGVTLQTTFVRVDSEGEKLASWVGYGEDKSVDAILENTK